MPPSAKIEPSQDAAPQPLAVMQAIAPYQQGKSQISGHKKVIKLSSNEGCFGPSPAAASAYTEVAGKLHRYPDGAQHGLRDAIASTHKIDANRIVCGNGSEELIGLLTRCYVGEADELLLSENHFVMCSIYGKAQGATIVLAPEDNYVTDIDAVLERVSPRTKMIALANPNNPTGTYVGRSEIQRLIDAVPTNILILLDGAYAEYVVRDDFDAGIQWVESNQNVVTTRTFSKMYGLAGLRIGWAYGPAPIIEVVNRLRTPFNASLPAMAAATAAIGDKKHVERVVQHNERWQKKIRESLVARDVTVVPSVANFYLMHFDNVPGRSTAGATSFLESKGIIPRPAGGDRCLRLTIGNDEENEAVLGALHEYLSDGKNGEGSKQSQ